MAPYVLSVRFEHHTSPRLGIGEASPRLSWSVEDSDPTFVQAATELEIVRRTPGAEPVVELVTLTGDAQILVPWPVRALQSRDRVDVRVRVRGSGEWSPWSVPATAEAGLLDPQAWVAQLVGAPCDDSSADLRRPTRLRRAFTAPAPVASARLYVTAHGLAEVEINGRRAGDEELTPGWTSYNHRLRYATFDVTDLLHEGANAIGVWLGDGWWRGRIGYGGGQSNVYGDRLAAAVQLEIITTDGSRLTVATDESWRSGPGPIVSSGLYDGEHFDAREHDEAWSTAGWRESDAWQPASVESLDASLLVAPSGPPVRCVEEIRPIEVTNRGNDRWLLDFGQNHSGRLRIRTDGPAGTVLTLRHSEVLDGDELATEPLRSARATDVLTLNGRPIDWEPRFTIHGYRYAEISGWVGELTADHVVSRVLHTDMERTGWFSSSSELVNRLHENVVWSLRGNFVDIPTDCPQRDERLGWTGDIQVFAPSAAFLYDVTGMLASWLEDVAAEQAEKDWVPLYVPYIPLEPFSSMPADPTAVWGDVTVLTPEVLHLATGDVDLLRRQYASATAWLNHVERAAGEDRICSGTVQLGDWLDPNAPPEDPMKAMTDPALVATAYFARSAAALSRVASTLGDTAAADKWDRVAGEVARAFAARYIDSAGHLDGDTQTAYALTTAFGLWPDERAREAGTARLATLVRQSGGRISTGFAGTPAVTDALSSAGMLTEAYALLECTDAPSWLYAVVNGGTTVWERWDSLRPDGSINAGSMTSFNHYALGAVADWLHRVVAGIAPEEAGWKTIRFAPRPGGSITRAAAEHRTPYGTASIAWRLESERLTIDVVVPVGARGVIDVPGVPAQTVGHGAYRFACAWTAAAGMARTALQR